MQNEEEAEKLFALMRQQFIDDPEENLEGLRECANSLRSDLSGSLQKALLVLHNMKGSAQAVGFAAFASVLHEAEEVLGALVHKEEKHEAIDHLFESFIVEVEGYFHRLALTLDDQLEMGSGCRRCLQDLNALLAPPAGFGFFDDEPAAVAAVVPVPVKEAEAPPEIEAAEASKARASVGKYLLLEQDNQLYAIHLEEVKEVISDHYLNPLPHPQAGLKGLIVVRNRALPVMDFNPARREEAANARNEPICAVICERDDQSFAFRVQKPRQVISLDAQEFESMAERHVLVRSVAQYKGESVLVVDLKGVTGS